MSLFNLLKRPRSAKPLEGEPVMRELPVPPTEAPPAPLPPSPDELRQKLFDAIATRDEAHLTALCQEHREFIREYAPTWMIVPDGLRANPAAAEWYTRGLRQLTTLCAG
jgi:hypothetical protein